MAAQRVYILWPFLPRSPAIVIGYLMKVRNWRLTESYKWVKDKWRLTVLNEGKPINPEPPSIAVVRLCPSATTSATPRLC